MMRRKHFKRGCEFDRQIHNTNTLAGESTALRLTSSVGSIVSYERTFCGCE